MNYKTTEKTSRAIKIFVEVEGAEIARAYIYIIFNGLHDDPYALLEDVFVAEGHRGQGHGKEIIKAVVEEAKKQGCYKLIGTSRYEREKVHKLYLDLGFEDYGKEFRINL